MAIRKLLLPLTGTVAGEAALATALTVARLWNAHLTTLHVRMDSRDVAPLAGEGLSGAMIEEMMAATEKESAARAQAVRAMFRRIVAEQGIAVQEPALRRRRRHRQFRRRHRPRGGCGGPAGQARRPDHRAASRGRRGCVVLGCVACGAVRIPAARC